VEDEAGRVSRVGTARALVLVGSALELAVAGVVAFVLLVFGPVLSRHGVTGPVVLGAVVFGVITLAAIVGANVVAVRAGSTRAVALGGCATLLLGGVLGIGVLLLIVLA
jgi:hypothetical protein